MPYFQPTVIPSLYISDGPMSIADLHTNFPPTNANRFMYAKVNDLYSEITNQGGIVVNETGSHWSPVRPNRLGAAFTADQNRTLSPLFTPPDLTLGGGALTVGRTIAFSNTYAYPGAKFHIKRQAGGTLLGVVLNGLGISLGVNGWAIAEFNGTTWVEVASGGLL